MVDLELMVPKSHSLGSCDVEVPAFESNLLNLHEAVAVGRHAGVKCRTSSADERHANIALTLFGVSHSNTRSNKP